MARPVKLETPVPDEPQAWSGHLDVVALWLAAARASRADDVPRSRDLKCQSRGIRS